MDNIITPDQFQEMVRHKMNTAAERVAYLEPWINAVKSSWSLIGVSYAISLDGATVRKGIKIDSNEKRDLWLDSSGKFYEMDKNEKLPAMHGGYDIASDKAVSDYDVIACKNSIINAIMKLPNECPSQDPVVLKAFRDLVASKLP